MTLVDLRGGVTVIGVVGGVTNDGDSGVDGRTGVEEATCLGVLGTCAPGLISDDIWAGCCGGATSSGSTILCGSGSSTVVGTKLLSGRGPGCTGVTGVNWRRNCLFLSVTRPEPSTLTRYLLCPMSSRMRPVLSHFLAILPAPCWFWIITLAPGCNGLRSLVFDDHLSAALMNLFFRASSLVSLLSTQISAGE